jgi:hypothetical protein
MSAVVGALRADLSASVGQFADDMGKAGDVVEKFATRFRSVASDVKKLGETMSIAISLPIIEFGREATKQATEANQAFAQVQARLTSMGNTSGRTSEQLDESAKSLAKISTFDDDEILRKVTAAMLTFGNVQGTIFDRAEKASVNLAAAMGGDLQDAAVKVGKALNDPIRGVTALQKLGVSFTQHQKEQIAQLVKSGQGYKAQGIILAELEKEFDGSAKAMREASPTGDLHQAWKEFSETIGKIVLEFLPPLTALLTKLVGIMQNMDPAVLKAVVVVAALVAVLGPLLVYVGAVLEAVVVLMDAFEGFAGIIKGVAGAGGVLEAGMAALGTSFLPLVAVLAAVGAFLYVFRDKFIAVFQDLYDQAQVAFGPPIQSIIKSFGEIVDKLMTGPLGAMLAQAASNLADFAATLLKVVGQEAIRELANFLQQVALVMQGVNWAIGKADDALNGFIKDWDALPAGVQKAINQAISFASRLTPILAVLAGLLGLITGGKKTGGAPIPDSDPLDSSVQIVGDVKKKTPPLVPPTFNMGKDKGADKIKEANKKLADGLRSLNDSVSKGLDAQVLPKATTEANALRAKIDELTASAKASGVNVSAYAGTIDSLRARIGQLEQEGLAKEAIKFGQEVAKDQIAVNEFAKGGLNPLEEALQAVDDKYQTLKDSIIEHIDTNKALANENDAARLTMIALEHQLARLEVAHATATAAAKAQYAAEQQIADLQTKAQNLQTAQQIRDFKANSTGAGAPISSHQADLQKIQDQLDADRIASAQRLIQLQEQEDKAISVGDFANADRIKTSIDLEKQYGDLVNSTSAQQIQNQEQLNQAISSFTDSLEAAFEDIGKSGANAATDIKNAFLKLLSDTLVKPLAQSAADDIGSVVKGLFGIGTGKKPTGTRSDPLFVSPANDIGNLLGGGGSGGLGGIGQSLGNGLKQLFGIGGNGNDVANGTDPIGDLLDSFGGAFAGGGTLKKGQWGIAGEKGIEPIYAANSNLQIVPHSAMGGGGSGGSVYIDARGAGPREIDELRGMVNGLKSGFKQNTWSAVNEGIARGKVQPPPYL